MMSMKIKILFSLFLLAILHISCKKEPKGNPGPNEIWLEYKAFNPTQLTVAAGTTVTFTNKDNADHTATSTGNFDSGKIKSGDTYTYTFATAGTYYFYCNYHSSNSSEQGAIRVQ
jgi:plastocyanin